VLPVRVLEHLQSPTAYKEPEATLGDLLARLVVAGGRSGAGPLSVQKSPSPSSQIQKAIPSMGCSSVEERRRSTLGSLCARCVLESYGVLTNPWRVLDGTW